MSKYIEAIDRAPRRFIRDESPELFAHFLASNPNAKNSIQTLQKGCWVAKTCKVFMEGDHFRLMGHARSMYQTVKDAGVLAMKGSEVFAEDLPKALENLGHQYHSGSLTSYLDYFPIHEYKLPLALTGKEANADFSSAQNLQLRYFEKYGELAQIPFPLAVYDWDQERIDRYRQLLQGRLSNRAHQICEKLFSDGLSIFVYHYPNPPIRVRHVDEALRQKQHPREGYLKRLDRLQKRTNVHRAIESWVKLWVRIIGLGYLPVTLSHHEVGQMVRSQNAVIDGGFVDTDSSQKISEIADPRVLTNTVAASFIELADTLEQFLLGSGYAFQKTYPNPSTHKLWILKYLFGAVTRCIDDEKKQGFALEDSIEKLLTNGANLEGLDQCFSAMFPEYEKFEADQLLT